MGKGRQWSQPGLVKASPRARQVTPEAMSGCLQWRGQKCPWCLTLIKVPALLSGDPQTHPESMGWGSHPVPGHPVPGYPLQFLCQGTAQTRGQQCPLLWRHPPKGGGRAHGVSPSGEERPCDTPRHRGAAVRHSSLWSGWHCGDSFSSRTPSGAHTQGSWVSHCHLARRVFSASRTWAKRGSAARFWVSRGSRCSS